MTTNINSLSQLQGGMPALPLIVTNSDWRFSIQFNEASDPSTPIDISGISFEQQLRRTALGILLKCCAEPLRPGSKETIGDMPASLFGFVHVKIARPQGWPPRGR